MRLPSFAFDPFFDETVVVSGVRAGSSRRQSLRVSIFDDALDVAACDAAMDSEMESIRCVAQSADWRFVRDGMVRGDTVRRDDGREYQVTRIGHDCIIGWHFDARRVK